ncbi:MAG: glycosyltransferase family 2 protein [bacterium]
MCKVSVIIPTHNRVNLLKNAVNSVLNQTYKKFELLIVDDASTDDTINYIKNIKDNRINFIRNEISKGGSGARNVGIKKAKGEYIAFLDDDDEWKKDKLQKQINLFKQDEEVGLVYTGAEIIYTNYKLKYKNLPSIKGNISEKILIKNYIGTTSSVIVKREILDETGYFDEELPALQDYDLWVRICQLTKIDCIEEPLINYYNRDNMTQISDDTNKYKIAIRKMEAKYNNLIKKLNKINKNERDLESFILLANKAKRNNNSKLARYYLRSCLSKKIKLKFIILFALTFFKFKYSVIFKSLLN